MSEEIKDITNETEEIEEVEEQEEISVTGGIMLLRTNDGRIVYEKVDEVSWEDITMFSEYLNRLKDIVWDEHVKSDKSEA